MLQNINSSLKKKIFFPALIRFRVALVRFSHWVALKRIRRKNKVKVAFFLIYESMWKYERLYFQLEEDKRFDPVVFVCPFTTYGKEIMKDEMDKAFESFKAKGYRVVKTLKSDSTWINIKRDFRPDIVFFTNPWPNTLPQYQILNFLDTLTCYVHYGFNSANLNHVYHKMPMFYLTWKVFLETSFHKKQAETFSPRRGANTFVTGYPGIDNLIDKQYQPKAVWKPQESEKKRVIWAPHHTIPGAQRALSYGTFLDYADVMFEIAQKYGDKIQICFKPHPHLKAKLMDPQVWGKERTEEYYVRWANLPNGQLNEGEYVDLFLLSDAMIHDSSSFHIEYLFVRKPVMFLAQNNLINKEFNKLGLDALKKINLGYSVNDIYQFIERTILGGIDDFETQRNSFTMGQLMPPNNKLASTNIYEYILGQIRY